MKGEERCIPWEPVPKEANRYMVLNVVRFEQMADSEGMPVAVTIASSTDRDDAHGQSSRTWRISFRHVAGFRFRPIAQPSGGSAVVRPDVGKQLTIALWEIVHSRWLPEAVGTLHSRPNAVHHYVIASSYVLYDVAAQAWDSEETSQ